MCPAILCRLKIPLQQEKEGGKKKKKRSKKEKKKEKKIKALAKNSTNFRENNLIG